MGEHNTWKLVISALLAALGAYFKALAAPLLVLVAVMVIDYISGISAAYVTGKLSSRTGLVGIIKKVSYLVIVAVGMAMDYIINEIGAQFGANLDGVYYVGLLVTVWLIINECISILENADEMGLPVPPFVGKLLEHLQKRTENKLENTQEDGENEKNNNEKPG